MSRDEAPKLSPPPTWHHLVAFEKTAEDICRLLGPSSIATGRTARASRIGTAEVHVADWKRLDRGRGRDEVRGRAGHRRRLPAIAVPVDFVGINYYKRGVMRPDPSVVVERARRVHLPESIYT